MYWFKCCCCTVSSIASLSSQITHSNILLLLPEMPNSLQLYVFFFLFFCQPYLKYWGSWSKKCFVDHQTANIIQLFVAIKNKLLRSIIFQNKSQGGGIPQGQLDKYSHLFISISVKQTLSSRQKPVYTVKILISDQIAFAAVLYFGQVFVFCRLIKACSNGFY